MQVLSKVFTQTKLKVWTCYTMPRADGFDMCSLAGGDVHTPTSLIAFSCLVLSEIAMAVAWDPA